MIDRRTAGFYYGSFTEAAYAAPCGAITTQIKKISVILFK